MTMGKLFVGGLVPSLVVGGVLADKLDPSIDEGNRRAADLQRKFDVDYGDGEGMSAATAERRRKEIADAKRGNGPAEVLGITGAAVGGAGMLAVGGAFASEMLSAASSAASALTNDGGGGVPEPTGLSTTEKVAMGGSLAAGIGAGLAVGAIAGGAIRSATD
jgi:hypothetical protein